jgi:hypothetical protein
MTENERDIVLVLEYAISTKAPPEKITAALQRLLAQTYSPPDPQVAERERMMKERREKALGPPNPINRGMVLPPPSPEELAQRELKMKEMAERAEKLKRPLARQVT